MNLFNKFTGLFLKGEMSKNISTDNTVEATKADNTVEATKIEVLNIFGRKFYPYGAREQMRKEVLKKNFK